MDLAVWVVCPPGYHLKEPPPEQPPPPKAAFPGDTLRDIALDGVQIGLGVAGLVPGWGEVADGADAAISLARGDHLGAAMSAAAMMPGVGWAPGGAKVIAKAGKIADGLRTLWRGRDAATTILAKGDDARRLAEGAQAASRGAGKGVKELPTLDAKGKVHGDLPKPQDLKSYEVEDLQRLRDDLRQSVEERIRKNSELGPQGGHGRRQAEEQDLITSIEKHLEDR